MKLILFFLLLNFTSGAQASFPELFGASAGNMALGNQAEKATAANNYYAAALLGYSKSTQYSFNVFYLAPQFEEIQNVTTKNEVTTVNQLETGNADVNPGPTTMLGAHLSTPLFSQEGPKFNLSIFAPFDRLMEAGTGDPYQPKYVMYENRFIRPILNFSLAQSFNQWSFSLGAQTGFQSNGESYFVTRTTNGTASVGKITFNAKPSLGVVSSIAYRTNHDITYLAFQQEMKSHFENSATGETEIASNASFPFDFKLSSLLYYDPMTIRAGHQVIRAERSLMFSVEYQQWENYQSATLKIKKQGGTINGSNNLEDLKLKNIFIPKIGLTEKIAENLALKIGYYYRPSPIQPSNLKNAGNSIDTDKHVGSFGAAYDVKLFGKALTVDLAYQAHFLKNKKITKTPGREDGDPSQPKIGSPGYRIGGMIHSLGLGISWTI